MTGKSLKTIKQWYNPCFAHYETLPFLSDTHSYEVYHVTEEQICDLLQYNFLLLYGKKIINVATCKGVHETRGWGRTNGGSANIEILSPLYVITLFYWKYASSQSISTCVLYLFLTNNWLWGGGRGRLTNPQEQNQNHKN